MQHSPGVPLSVRLPFLRPPLHKTSPKFTSQPRCAPQIAWEPSPLQDKQFPQPQMLKPAPVSPKKVSPDEQECTFSPVVKRTLVSREEKPSAASQELVGLVGDGTCQHCKNKPPMSPNERHYLVRSFTTTKLVCVQCKKEELESGSLPTAAVVQTPSAPETVTERKAAGVCEYCKCTTSRHHRGKKYLHMSTTLPDVLLCNSCMQYEKKHNKLIPRSQRHKGRRKTSELTCAHLQGMWRNASGLNIQVQGSRITFEKENVTKYFTLQDLGSHFQVGMWKLPKISSLNVLQWQGPGNQALTWRKVRGKKRKQAERQYTAEDLADEEWGQRLKRCRRNKKKRPAERQQYDYEFEALEALEAVEKTKKATPLILQYKGYISDDSEYEFSGDDNN